MTVIVAPERRTGRPTIAMAEVRAKFYREVCQHILEIDRELDFRPSSRGWAYTLEGRGFIDKGAFDLAEKLINDARARGDLPLDICADDSKRATVGLEHLDHSDVTAEVDSLMEFVRDSYQKYTPFSFWDDQDHYVEILVEKIDLIGLFRPSYQEFHVPCTNLGGWADLNSRGDIMERFKKRSAQGKHCVLLPFTDHDIGGLAIADAIRANLYKLARVIGWEPSPANLTIDRFGLDADTIRRLRLPWINGLITGSGKDLGSVKHHQHFNTNVQDYIRKYGKRKCEANALVTRIEEARELCRDAILRYVPSTAVEAYERKLKTARGKLRRAMREKLAKGKR
jgi:hypothetical protein